MTKVRYKEKLWNPEPEENPFKVGDRVAVYSDGIGSPAKQEWFVSIVEDCTDGVIFVTDRIELLGKGEFGVPFHFRQCRLLVEEKPREWWVIKHKFADLFESGHKMDAKRVPSPKCPNQWIKVREVQPEERESE